MLLHEDYAGSLNKAALKFIIQSEPRSFPSKGNDEK